MPFNGSAQRRQRGPGAGLYAALLWLWCSAAARADTGAANTPPTRSEPAPACGSLREATDQPSDEYRAAVHEAVVDHAASRFMEARAQFLRAHELYPNARTLRGLGMVEFELRNYGESVRYLEAALACPVRALDPELAEETQLLLSRARAYVGEVHVALEPATATVIIDGVTAATGPKASFLLLVGDHLLEFRAQGLPAERRTVSIRSGERTTLQVVLGESLAAPRAALDLKPEPPRSAERPRLVKKWWLWTGVGVLLAGAITGSLLAARARQSSEPPSTTDQVPPGVVLTTLVTAP